LKIRNIKTVFFENSLVNETIEVLGLKSIDALEKELELLSKDVEEKQTYLAYND
tara:strand:+ start:443 stop:604 length:162 start_codon:yes stop_codon:yes gene_type:complete